MSPTSGKNSLLPGENKSGKGDDSWKAKSAMDDMAQSLVTDIVQEARSVLGIPSSRGGSRPQSESLIALSKTLLYGCCLLFEREMLTSKPPGKDRLLEDFIKSVCLFLFQDLYDTPGGGKEYEYFLFIFQQGYLQLRQEVGALIQDADDQPDPIEAVITDLLQPDAFPDKDAALGQGQQERLIDLVKGRCLLRITSFLMS